MNKYRTCGNFRTRMARGCSRHVRYEIVAKDGRVFGWNITFATAAKAAEYARVL